MMRAVAGMTDWSTAQQLLAQAMVIVVAIRLFSQALAWLTYPDHARARKRTHELIL